MWRLEGMHYEMLVARGFVALGDCENWIDLVNGA